MPTILTGLPGGAAPPSCPGLICLAFVPLPAVAPAPPADHGGGPTYRARARARQLAGDRRREDEEAIAVLLTLLS